MHFELNEALLRTGTLHGFHRGPNPVLRCCGFQRKSQVPVAEVGRSAEQRMSALIDKPTRAA